MSDSLAVWHDGRLAKAYGLLDQGEIIDGELYLSTPIGLAAPSFYQGDAAFLEWLGPLLLGTRGKLGRMSLSRILTTTGGRHSQRLGEDTVLLSTWESGPACDVHNTFELFTVLAGVAHFHRLTSRADQGTMAEWADHYARLYSQLSQVKHPDLNKRALAYWESLVETWGICLQEGLDILGKAVSDAPTACLALGVEQFSDFVYLADVHMVHYNPIARCHWNSPTVDIAALLLSSAGDLRLAENMLLSYEKVRSLSPTEKRLILAQLWLPREVTLDALQVPGLNILAIRRMQAQLELKIGLISDLEELLLPPQVEDEPVALADEDNSAQPGKQASQVSAQTREVSARRAVAVEMQRRSNPTDGQPVDSNAATPDWEEQTTASADPNSPTEPVEEVNQMEEEKILVDAEENQEEVMPGQEPAEETTEAKPAKKALVWKPFPRPLNAPPEPVATPPAAEPLDEMDEDIPQ